MRTLISFLIFTGICGQIFASEISPSVGITKTGDHWFISPTTDAVVVFMADGRIMLNDELLTTCPIAKGSIYKGTVIITCEVGGPIELVDISDSARPEVFSLNYGLMTLVSGNLIVSQLVESLSPSTIPNIPN